MGTIAVVAGATGLVGKELVKLLIEDTTYLKVITLGRRTLDIQHPKLEQRIVDFTKLDEHAACFHDADVFCALGTTMKQAGSKEAFYQVDYEYPMALGRMALKHGANQFLIVTATGANPKSLFYYSRVKGEIEQSLRELGIPSLHIFRPSFLLGDRTEVRSRGQFAQSIINGLSVILPQSIHKRIAIHVQTVAQSMMNTAKNRTQGQHSYDSSQMDAIAKAIRH
jgi:uncharacterized protein YbjT (DUF2867 family)